MDRRKWTTVEEIVANTRGGKRHFRSKNERKREKFELLFVFFLNIFIKIKMHSKIKKK